MYIEQVRGKWFLFSVGWEDRNNRGGIFLISVHSTYEGAARKMTELENEKR